MIPITECTVSVFTVPTDGPESDGTLEWRSTTIVIVEAAAGATRGLGYTYAHRATATLIGDMLLPLVRGRDAMDEYGYDLYYFRRMADAGAVDVLQADATRCAGITGFMQVGALCDAYNLPLSSHTASALHVHPCCALGRVRHLEHFHDHERMERLLFDGLPVLTDGRLRPDLSRPGLGLDFKRADASRYAA